MGGWHTAVTRVAGWIKPQWGHAVRAHFGIGLGVQELARRMGVTEKELQAFQPHYGRAAIPKRRGGVRTLDIPDQPTKSMQRKVLHRVLARLRAHPAACGFELRSSIVNNALPHVGQAVVVKLDVRDFFASTRAERVNRYFRRVGWSAEAAGLLTVICTHKGGLPQGAPTSPRLSNLVNFGLDAAMMKVARKTRCAYTRYADDLTLSMTYRRSRRAGRRVRGAVQKVRQTLKGFGYEMHGRPKLQILRQHQRQQVTGLVGMPFG